MPDNKIEIKKADNNPKPHWNKKLYRSWFGRKVCRVGQYIENAVDAIKDRKICGRSLSKYVPSEYRDTMGATGSQSTHYYCMKKICSSLELSEDDKFIDIGCGKGRVIAYFLRENVKTNLYGVELNPKVAAIAEEWSKKYENAHIFQGDAFKLDYNEYTVLFLFRPFEKETFFKFALLLEEQLTHPIKLIYWCDTQSGNFMLNRSGWTLCERNWIFKKGIMPICPCPQRYSVWIFSPDEMKKANKD